MQVRAKLTIAIRVLAPPLLTVRDSGRNYAGRSFLRMLIAHLLLHPTRRSPGLGGHGGSAGVPAPAGPGGYRGVAD